MATVLAPSVSPPEAPPTTEPSPPDHLLEAAVALWSRSGTVGRLPVQGDSMSPLLREGDHVRVRGVPDVRAGDVVIARTASGLVGHRVVAVNGDQVTLRGDNSPAPDPPVALSAILGRVVAVETSAGPALRFDLPGTRTLAQATAAAGRLQSTVGFGPRPRIVTRLAMAVSRWLLPEASREEHFLLLAARRRVPPAAAARATRLADAGLDWDRVIDRAREGGMAALLHHGAWQLPVGVVPDRAAARLAADYAAAGARSHAARRTLGEVLSALAAQGVPVLAHKGAALTATVFEDAALHPFDSIDLSVPDEDLGRALSTIAALGIVDTGRHPGGGESHPVPVRLGGSSHPDLDPSRHGRGRWRSEDLDWTTIWAGATEVAVDGRSMLVPCPTHLVLTLAADCVRRGFTPVRTVSDLAEAILAGGDRIDWRRLGAALAASGLDRRSWIALELARDWFGAPVPAAMLEPPRGTCPSVVEWWLFERKRRSPLVRVPTRMLWSGGRA